MFPFSCLFLSIHILMSYMVVSTSIFIQILHIFLCFTDDLSTTLFSSSSSRFSTSISMQILYKYLYHLYSNPNHSFDSFLFTSLTVFLQERNPRILCLTFYNIISPKTETCSFISISDIRKEILFVKKQRGEQLVNSFLVIFGTIHQ